MLSMVTDVSGYDLGNTTHVIFADPAKGYIHAQKDMEFSAKVWLLWCLCLALAATVQEAVGALQTRQQNTHNLLT